MYGCALLLDGTFVFNCVDPSDDFIQDKKHPESANLHHA